MMYVIIVRIYYSCNAAIELLLHSKINDNYFMLRLILSQLHTRHFEHYSTCFARICITVIILQIDNFPNSRLDDNFGAFILWVESETQGG